MHYPNGTITIQGGTDLTYAWTVSPNASSVEFSDNNSNSASQTSAYFTQTGTYTFLLTVTDPAGDSVTSSVSVPVNTITKIAVTSVDPVPLANGTQQFTATAYDQFGHPLATQPSFTWNVTGTAGYTISSSGKLTAGPILGPYSVTATSSTAAGSSVGSPVADSFAPVHY